MSPSMTSRTFGLKGFVAPDAPTLADVQRANRQAPGLTKKQRADRCCAVQKVADVLGLPPADVPAHPAFLRLRLARIEPAAHGLTPARWNNIRSLTRRALETAGVTVLPGRYLAPLDPLWADLDRLIEDKAIRMGLRRFAHFCSAQAIAPDAVDDAVVAAYRRALEEESLLKRAYKVWRNTIRYWNQAVDRVPGWPQRRLTVPPRADRYGGGQQPSESLCRERDAWLKRLGGGGFLDEPGFTPLKESTRESQRRMIGQFLAALAARGHDLAALPGFAEAFAPAMVRVTMRFFHERAGGRPTGRMLNLARLALSIARHWTHAPADQIAELQEIARACDPGERGLTAKNRALLRQFATPEAKRRLAELPIRVLEGLPAQGPLTVRQALRVQTALVLQLLLRAPMRIANLAGLRLDRHLVRPGGPRGELLIVVPAGEVKNRVELTFPLKAPLTRDLLRLYLERARPVLARQPTPYLFPGGVHGAKHTNTLRQQVGDATRHGLGIRITPHQFRHLGAKLVLDARPGCHEIVRALLGHKQIATTLRYYAGMEQEAAVLHLDEVIADLGGEGQQRRRRAG